MEPEKRVAIYKIVKGAIQGKIASYKAETEYKPFSEALFSKKNILLASIIQSMYTSFGMSAYEQIAVVLANRQDSTCVRDYSLLGSVNESATLLIDQICNEPIGNTTKAQEIDLIRQEIRAGLPHVNSDSTVDIFVTTPDREIYIDITTVKSNKKEARALRKKLLLWAALRMSQNKKVNVQTFIGIPYNPYHPDAYSRGFVLGNLHRDEVLVQDELWDLLGGEGTFAELVRIFEEVGVEIRTEIDNFLS